MQKTVYTHTASGQSWDYRLPKILRWNGVSTSNITEATMADFGITKTTVDIPDAPPVEPVISDAIAAKERAFAAMLAHYAAAFDIDLTTLPDINISAMLTAAHQAGVQPADIADATAMLLAAKADIEADIEAEANMTWAECWQGLKERLPGYLNEMTQ